MTGGVQINGPERSLVICGSESIARAVTHQGLLATTSGDVGESRIMMPIYPGYFGSQVPICRYFASLWRERTSTPRVGFLCAAVICRHMRADVWPPELKQPVRRGDPDVAVRAASSKSNPTASTDAHQNGFEFSAIPVARRS